MKIKLNGFDSSVPVSITEASLGIELGTLSGGTGEYEIAFGDSWYTALFETSNSNSKKINGNTLRISTDWYLDYETKKFFTFPVNQQNGNIIDYGTATSISTENSGQNPTVRIVSGNEEEIFTISITDKVETINLTTPTPFLQNRYGSTLAQINPTDSNFSTVFFEGPSFLEISGTNLKLKDGFFLSESGVIRNQEGTQKFDTNDETKFSNLKFILPGGFTTDNADPTQGFTIIPPSSYLSSIFASSNINTTPEITLSTIEFLERDYGSIIASINYSGSEEVSYTVNHSFLELSGTSQIKLKDAYFYNEVKGRIEDKDGTYWALADLSANSNLEITASNNTNQTTLITETLTISELVNTVFADSNVDGTPQISLTPVPFYDKDLGAIIATINYSGAEQTTFTLRSESGGVHDFLEMSGTNQIKLKDNYFYDKNTDQFLTKDLTYPYKLSEQGTTYNKINILAINSETTKNLASELITFSDISSTVFSPSNILDKDESYTFVTDLKIIENHVNYPKTGREEYQKDIGKYWSLKDGEKISYSFLEPGASYHGTYSELDGLIETGTALQDAIRKAFSLISSYADLTFEEINETGNIVGDIRLGIADGDHFGMALSYAAYSQEISSTPKGGNIFFNGTLDLNNDGICDFHDSTKMQESSWNFLTVIHEILHSLGLKHPHDAFDSSDQEEGNHNIVSKQFDQYTHTIMSYNPLRGPDPSYKKYDGIILNAGSGGQYYPTTPMLFDVMAIQEMYGSAPTNANDDTVYSFTPDAPPFESIYDTGGIDTLDLAALYGDTQLDLTGNTLSVIGNSYLLPFESKQGAGTTYGDTQGSALSIIAGTEIEKILLPADTSTINTGNYSTYIVGKENCALNTIVNASEIGIKASGYAHDTIQLNQTASNWAAEFAARHVGNNGVGATDEEIKLSSYLKHDLSVDLALGTDKILGTNGNDALFLQNFGTTGNLLYQKDTNHSASEDRILGVEEINLQDGNNFLDLTSTTTSLATQNINITTGSGNDILWLSDANEIISSGDGNDQIIINGGIDSLTTGLGNDTVTITNSTGNLTLLDFNPLLDKFVFHASAENLTTENNTIHVNNSLGGYTLTFNDNTDLSSLNSFSTFI